MALDGNLALALEDAVIAGAAYDLLATDLLAWIYSGAAGEESTAVDCTMAHFVFNDGVAKTEDLYIETDKMVATGEAEFDFVREKMDLKLSPRSKSRALEVPHSLSLRGDFDDPHPTISPLRAVADAYAQVITLIPQLTMKLFGVKLGEKNENQPCHS